MLFVDRRHAVTGPGTHALVVGVSSYPHLEGGTGERARVSFGMSQLSSAAASALTIAEYLAATTHSNT